MGTPTQGTELVQKAEPLSPHQERWTAAAGLRCTLSVELSIPGITIADLLGLEAGSVIDSRHPEGTPLPLWVNGITVGWVEFDVVGKHLAIRLTEVR